MLTKKGFAEGINLLSITFPNLELSEKTLKVWKQLLDDLTDEQFKEGILRICRDTKELYPNSNIVALIRDQIIDNVEERAFLLWNTVVKTMRTHGVYRSVKFDDPVIHSVIELMGGWIEFCHMQTDKWMRKEFINVYKILSKRDKHPEYLKGIFEIENTANGYLKKKPELKVIDTGYKQPQKQIQSKTEEIAQKLLSKMEVK